MKQEYKNEKLSERVTKFSFLLASSIASNSWRSIEEFVLISCLIMIFYDLYQLSQEAISSNMPFVTILPTNSDIASLPSTSWIIESRVSSQMTSVGSLFFEFHTSHTINSI